MSRTTTVARTAMVIEMTGRVPVYSSAYAAAPASPATASGGPSYMMDEGRP